MVAEFWTESQSIIMGKTKMTDPEELKKRKRIIINKQNGNNVKQVNNQRELHLPLSFLFQRFLDFSEEI